MQTMFILGCTPPPSHWSDPALYYCHFKVKVISLAVHKYTQFLLMYLHYTCNANAEQNANKHKYG